MRFVRGDEWVQLGAVMTKGSKSKSRKGELRREYDFSEGVRGKHVRRMAAGTNLVLLRPEVAAAFPNADAVNKALLGLMKQKKGS
jgi:hypothetical protein